MPETYPVNALKSEVPWSQNQNQNWHKFLLIVLMVQVKGEVGLWCLVSFWTPRNTDLDCWLGLLVRAEHCTVGLPHQTSLMLVFVTPHSVNCYPAKIVGSFVLHQISSFLGVTCGQLVEAMDCGPRFESNLLLYSSLGRLSFHRKAWR